jgi:hypothetical protein
MDEDSSRDIATRVLKHADGFYFGQAAYEQAAADAIERAVRLAPEPVADRIRWDDDEKNRGNVLVELVTEGQLVEVRVVRHDEWFAGVRMSGRRWDDGVSAIEMEQYGQRRDWRFRFGDRELEIHGLVKLEESGQHVPDESELLARAIAGKLGW